jgi:hypothetical protein
MVQVYLTLNLPNSLQTLKCTLWVDPPLVLPLPLSLLCLLLLCPPPPFSFF